MIGQFLTMTPLIFVPGMMLDARLFSPKLRRLRENALSSLPLLRKSQPFPVWRRPFCALHRPDLRWPVSLWEALWLWRSSARLRDRVERLALIDTNPLAELEKVQKNRDRQIAWVCEEGRLAEIMQDEMKPHYLADSPKRADILDLCMDAAMALGPTVFVNQSRALQSRSDQSDTLRRVTVPTLILCGEQDALCPIERHQLMAALIPHANLVVIPGAGHLPTLEQPQATTDALKWLED